MHHGSQSFKHAGPRNPLSWACRIAEQSVHNAPQLKRRPGGPSLKGRLYPIVGGLVSYPGSPGTMTFGAPVGLLSGERRGGV